jgi:hypothetical protein
MLKQKELVIIKQFEKKTGKKAFWREKPTKSFLEHLNAVIPEIELDKWRDHFAKEFLTPKELKDKTIDQAWENKYNVNINYEIYSWHLYSFNLEDAIKMKREGLKPYDAYIEYRASQKEKVYAKEKAKAIAIVKPNVHLEKQTIDKYELMEKEKNERTTVMNELSDKIKGIDENIKKLSKERDKMRKDLSEKTKNQKKDDLTGLINRIEERDERVGNLMKTKAKINKEINTLKKEIKEFDGEMAKIEKLMKKEEKIAKKEKALGLIEQYEKETGKNMMWRGNLTKGFLSFLKIQLTSSSDLMDELKTLKENILKRVTDCQKLGYEFMDRIEEQLSDFEKDILGEIEKIIETEKKESKNKEPLNIFSSKMNYLKQLMELPLQKTKMNSLTVVGDEVKDTEGNVYLGTQIEDEGEKGFSTIKEIEDTIKEIEEDMVSYYKVSEPKKAYNYYMDGKKKVFIKIEDLRSLNLEKGERWVLNRKTANARLMRLALIVKKSTKGQLESKSNKEKALKIINNFRIRIDFNPINIQDYLLNIYEIEFS